MARPFRKQGSEKIPDRKPVPGRMKADRLPANVDLEQSDKDESKRWYQRTPVIVSLIPVLGGLLIAVFQLVPSILNPLKPSVLPSPLPSPDTFAGKVFDERTGKVIDGAKVSLEAKGVPPVIHTDSEGAFSFRIPPGTSEVKLRVDAEGYHPFGRRIDVSSKSELEDVRLKPLTSPSPTPTITTASENTNKTTRKREPKSQPRTLTKEEKIQEAIRDLHPPKPR